MTNPEFPRTRRALALGLLVCLVGVGCEAPASQTDPPDDRQTDAIYQVATLRSLVQGKYEGTHTVADLTERGTLGLGTVDRLDGEMVMVDGRAYAIRNDGTADALDGGTGIPFGVVTPFEVDTTVTLRNVDSFADFQSRLDERQPSGNQLYAFRVSGEFDRLETRSVPEQQPPYPELSDVIANQTRFTFDEVRGTMVGFRIPEAFDGVNAVGHHAHFLTAGRDGGGHVLDVRASEITVQIDRSSSLEVNPRGSQSGIE